MPGNHFTKRAIFSNSPARSRCTAAAAASHPIARTGIMERWNLGLRLGENDGFKETSNQKPYDFIEIFVLMEDHKKKQYFQKAVEIPR
jgi:hypothetical protein